LQAANDDPLKQVKSRCFSRASLWVFSCLAHHILRPRKMIVICLSKVAGSLGTSNWEGVSSRETSSRQEFANRLLSVVSQFLLPETAPYPALAGVMLASPAFVRRQETLRISGAQ
jgi:hypothetical protein